MLEIVQRLVDGIGLQWNSARDCLRKIEFAASSQFEQEGQLLKQMVVCANYFGFPGEQLAVGINFKRLIGDTGYNRATHDCQ